jgi:hypothetical protein
MQTELLPSLPDELYWGDHAEEINNLLDERMNASLPGAVIGGPGIVPLKGRVTLPIAGCYVEALGDPTPPIESLATVVASCLEDRKVYAGAAFTPPMEVEDPVPPSLGPQPRGYRGTTFTIDLYKQLNLPRKPGTYRVSLVLRDQVTNTIQVQIIEDPGNYQDPEVIRFIQKHSKPVVNRREWPRGAASPNPDPEDPFPGRPTEPGIQLNAPRVHLLKGQKPCMLFSSYYVPVSPEDITAIKALPTRIGLRPVPKALIPITLVIVPSDAASPLVYRLELPCYSIRKNTETQSMAGGEFSLNILDLPGIWTSPRTNFIYGFCGDIQTKAVPLAFITSDMLHANGS